MLRFCFGASGSGKSSRLLTDVIRESMESPGTMFFIIVPDQFTMQVQRDVVRLHPDHGIMNIDVLSLSRLRHRIFDEVSGPAVPVLDDMGKTLVLRRIAQENQKDLPVLGRMMSLPGFTDEVKSLISEFIQYGVGPDDLDRLIGACGLHGRLAARLRDLQTIYRGFRKFTEGRFITAEDTMTELAARIPRSRMLRDSVIVFDGFTGFTPIQYQVLSELIKTARSVTVSLVMDPDEDPYGTADKGEESVFALTAKTVADLIRLEPKHKIADDIFIKERPVRRLRDNPPLAFLEEELFRHRHGAFDGDTKDALSIVEARDPADECTECCLEICSIIRADSELRFENIAVMSTDPETYGPEMERTAARFSIPVYIDRTAGISMDPLIELTESALEVIKGGYQPAAVMRFMRCRLSGFSRYEADRFQLYIEALGIRGRKRYAERFLRTPWKGRSPEEQAVLLDEINASRERVSGLLSLIDTKEANDVRSFSEALIRLFDELRVQEKLAELAVERRDAGDAAGMREYEQIYGKVIGLITQMVSLIGESEISVREYWELIKTGINKITIGMLPSGIDRVMVGDMERTRLGEKKVLFILGVNDTLLPKTDSGGGILSEIERQFLSEAQTGIDLAPGPVRKLAYDREYLYMNLTKPSDRLILSYSLMGTDGKSMRPADLIRRIGWMFPGIKRRSSSDRSLPERTGTVENAVVLAAAGLRGFADGEMDSGEEKSFGALLNAVAEASGSGKKRLEDLADLAFFRYEEKKLGRALSKELYGNVLENSVSRIETFAGCPYAHFAGYGLRLRESSRYELSPADLGSVYHEVLETADRRLREKGLSWQNLPGDGGREMIATILEDISTQYGNNILLSNARYQNMMGRMNRVLLRTVDTISYQLSKGSFVTEAAEWDFRRLGNTPETVMELGDAAGSRIVLHGRIDRIDTCAEADRRYLRIVDFKSGARTFDPTLFYNGLELQLMMYLRVAMSAERKYHPSSEIIPAGVFYYHIDDPFLSAENDKITDDVNSGIRKKLRMSGLALADMKALTLMDRDMAAGVSSDIMPVAIARDGNFKKTSRVLTADGFRAAFARTDDMIVSTGRRILDGDIAVSPYRYKRKTPCTYCAYRSMCGFDRQVPGYRLRDIKPVDLEEAMRSEGSTEHGEDLSGESSDG